MAEEKIYEALANYMDQGVMGTPVSPALLEILTILFPPEEAEMALKLPMQNQSLSDLKALFPEKGDALEAMLDRMVRRGTVFTSRKPGQEPKYRLFPSVVGWSETPFWAGKDTEAVRKLARLWLRYREEAFGAELARGMPVMRVVPVEKSLRDSRQILPFDVLRPKVEATSFRAVAHCPCRQMKRYVGEGCDHSTENCLHFGSMARYMVDQGMAREITVDETMDILGAAHQEGLVHTVDNLEGHMGTICNCCGCACLFLDTQKKMGLRTISSSNYVAAVGEETCVGCGTCEQRCPMDAIAVGDEGVATVNAELCIGCGVCTPTCEVEAVRLVQRAEVAPPPDPGEFLARRWKH
ncbi:MAG: 4Fe-4S binding protein [Desulfobacterales bacterium]|nr:4Fe-4S binding protein [Desulfobacterales bacterium]